MQSVLIQLRGPYQMHIGFLSPEYVLPGRIDGGLANYLRRVGKELTFRNHGVSVFVISGQNKKWDDGAIRINEVKVPRLRHFGFVTILLNQLLAAKLIERAVWKEHRRNRIDVIQVSSYKAPGYTLRRNGRVPLVCRVSSYSPILRSAYGRNRNISEYLSDWLEIRQVLDANRSFAPSIFMSRIYKALEGKAVDVINSPAVRVDIETDSTFYNEQLKDERYLLFFGTLSKIKGVDLLAEALPTILAEDESLKIVLIGRDDGMPNGQRVIEFLNQKCARYISRILHFDALPKGLLYPVISGAIGTLMPSRVDNYPNSCLESLALGVPVIGSNDSSVEEIIEDGKTGFLFKNGDSKSLSSSISKLLSLSSERYHLMKRNAAHASADMVAEDRVGQLIAYYESLIAEFSNNLE